jgi:hypothetical protein
LRPPASRPDRRGRPGLTRRRAGALALLGFVATFLLATGATARPTTPPRALTAADFHPIVLPPGAYDVDTLSTENAASAAADAANLEPIPDFEMPRRSFAPRPATQPQTSARAIPKVPPLRLTGHHASGPATWYCQAGVSACYSDYPGGLYAAAGPGLRVGDWRGRRVQVCGGGNCVVVTLVDWCACAGGGRLIDLYSDAYRRLAPLSTGTLRVKVSW